MKLDSKYFDQIRIKPDHLSAGPSEPMCDGPGCTREGAYRAPKGRMREGQYFHFCLDHVREYNKSYNYFAGMPERDIAAYRVDAATGHRPTWTMGARRARPGEGTGPADRMEDVLGVFGGFARQPRPERAAARPPLRNAERHSFAVLDLEGDEQQDEIRARYKALVKRLHPDANGGDRSREEKLREIIQAYKQLRAAGYC